MNKKVLLPLSSLLFLLPSCAKTENVVSNDYLVDTVLRQATANLSHVTGMKGESLTLEDQSPIYPKNMRPYVDYARKEATVECAFYRESSTPAVVMTTETETEEGTNAQRFVTDQTTRSLVTSAHDTVSGVNYVASHNEIEQGGKTAAYDTVVHSDPDMTEAEIFDDYVEILVDTLADALTGISGNSRYQASMDGDDVVLTYLTASTGKAGNPLYPGDSEKVLSYGETQESVFRFEKWDGYRLASIEMSQKVEYFTDCNMKNTSAVVATMSEKAEFSYDSTSEYDGDLSLPVLENALAKAVLPEYLLVSTGAQQSGTISTDETVGYQMMTGEQKYCYTGAIDLTAFANEGTISFTKGALELTNDNTQFVVDGDLTYTNPSSGEYHFENVATLYVEIVTDLDGSDAVVTFH